MSISCIRKRTNIIGHYYIWALAVSSLLPPPPFSCLFYYMRHDRCQRGDITPILWYLCWIKRARERYRRAFASMHQLFSNVFLSPLRWRWTRISIEGKFWPAAMYIGIIIGYRYCTQNGNLVAILPKWPSLCELWLANRKLFFTSLNSFFFTLSLNGEIHISCYAIFLLPSRWKKRM